MPAIVTIGEKNGPGALYTDKTAGVIRFKNADDPNVDFANPLIIPPSGTEFSYEKWLRFRIGATGPSVSITNLRFYTDGNNNLGNGVAMYVRTSANYSVPAKGVGTTGYTNAFTYTANNPLSLGAGPYSGTNVEIGDHCVLLMAVSSIATQGQTPSETLTFTYDEI